MNCFLAICKDRPDDPDRFYYTVYFVNNSDLDIVELHSETGGFMSCDDDLIQTSRYSKNLGRVPANGYIEVEKDDEGAFDFEIDFSFELIDSTCKKIRKAFTIRKYFRDATEYVSLPVLNKAGYLIKET